ncbi:MAG: glycosyltransferase [Candidatus Dormibacteria bacterium]
MISNTKVRSSATPIPRVLQRTLQNPLLRNGYLLTLSSGLSALIGMGYWVMTAWKYDPAAVGRNYAAISMMMFLAALAQLDLSSAMVRFVANAGRHTMRFVACSYLVSGSLAVVVSAGFLALVGHIAPGIAFLHDDPLLAGSFVCATTAYTIFVLQDSVLTGLRRTAWVPLENVVFACVKVVLVVVLAAAMPAYGVFTSWTLSLAGIVLVTSVLLFRWAIPNHQRRNNGDSTLPPLRLIVRFVALDYLGALGSIAAITMLPILVINQLGPEQGAYFSLAWVIAFSLHLLNINMGSSLVVETAIDQSQLGRRCRQVMSHTSKLLVPAVLVLMPLAPHLLSIFGQPYRSAGGVLRLLALASLPHLLVSTAVSSARAQRRMVVVAGVLGSSAVLTLAMSWLLLQVMGLPGVGLAWLLAQSFVAGVLLIRRDLWLNLSDVPAGTRGAGLARRRWALMVFWVRVATAMGVRRWVDRRRAHRRERGARSELAALLPGLLPTLPAVAGSPDPTTWTTAQPIPTTSDLIVALLSPTGGTPVAVLKVAHSPETIRELRSQQDALATLLAYPGLVGWRELLPRVIESREEETHSLALETFLPEISLATLLAGEPDSLKRLMPGVLASIAHLHQRTGQPEIVDHSHLDRWVDEPMESLRDMCLAIAPASILTVERLGQTLRDSLTGRRVLVSWTHGDFTPGNVLLTADRERVSGIVDWGGARLGELAILDGYLMLLTATSQTEGRELGAIVQRLLRAGGLPAHQRRLLDQTHALPDEPRHDILDERTTILLTWLHHVAELQRKCNVYREHRIWWACNVEPVLRAFAVLAPDVKAGAPPDEVTAKLSVSVIICSYTEQRWEDLVAALASVQRQTSPPEEIILVIDHCPGLLRRAAGELEGVQVVTNRHHQGLSGARNTGLDIATSQVVAFLDDDAAADADWIARLLAGYSDSQVGGVGGRVLPNWRDKRPAWFPTEFDWVVGCSYRGLPTTRGPVRNFIGANMSFRRELLLTLGGFHTALGRIGTRPLGCEETELCIRIQRTYPDCVLVYEPAAQVRHSVPASRGTWSYFHSRCYAEGLSKATVSRLAGANRALSSERSYLLCTITRGIMRSLRQVLRGRLSGIATALAMVAGVTTTVLGYAVGCSTRRKE